MKLFLAQNANFSMSSDTSSRDGGTICFGIKSDQLKSSLPENLDEVQACKDLLQRLHLGAVGQENSSSAGQSKERQWIIIDLRYAETNFSGQPGRSRPMARGTATPNGSEKLWVRIPPGSVTDVLVDLFGRDVTLQVQISNMSCENYGEMDIHQDQKYACEGEMALYSGHQNLVYYFNNGYKISGNITITVTVDEKNVKLSPGLVVNDRLMIFKKMLQDEVGTDVVIIPKKGKQVKAHKSVLSTHSEVFTAMFQSDMKESKTPHTIKMPDMSEQSIRALLAYLYYWDETAPDSKPMVAYEMLYAGNKYIIPVLETAMKKLLLGKPNKWYDADVAMKLFLLAKNLPTDGDPLKMKAIKVLKMNFKTLEKSPTYTALFNEDPKAAMELCKFAFAA